MSRDNDARVFLGRLPDRIRESDIERFFKGYGRIRDINVKKNFAFVVSTSVHVCRLFRSHFVPSCRFFEEMLCLQSQMIFWMGCLLSIAYLWGSFGCFLKCNFYQNSFVRTCGQ